MRERCLFVVASLLAACRTDALVLSPDVVREGEVMATLFSIRGLAPDRYLDASGDRLVLAADYAATVGDATGTAQAASGEEVAVQLDRELPVGAYALEVTARGDQWRVEGALTVVPSAAMVDAPVQPACASASAAGLVACYSFEGDTHDSSVHQLDGVPGGGTSFIGGRIGTAISLSAGQVTVAEAPALALAQLTVEAWIRPRLLPTGTGRAGIVDSNGRFGMFVRAGGELACTASLSVSKAAVAPVDQWTHVACTYDGSTLRMIVNGVQVAVSSGGSTLATGTQGLTIGADNPTTASDRFAGDIDEVRLYAEARPPNVICADAQLTACL